MPERSQRVVLVRHTLDPEALTALGARLCYAGGDVDRLLKTIEEKDSEHYSSRRHSSYVTNKRKKQNCM